MFIVDFNRSKLFSSSLTKGSIYGESKVTSIWFFNYDDKNIYIDDWYNLFRIKDVNNKIYSKDSFCIIALFLKHMSLSSIIELREFSNFFMESALNFQPTTELAREGQIVLKKLNDDEKARFIAASIEDKEIAYNSDMHYSKLEGIQEGIKENTVKTVKALYANGASLELISKSIGLSIDEIKKIIE